MTALCQAASVKSVRFSVRTRPFHLEQLTPVQLLQLEPTYDNLYVGSWSCDLNRRSEALSYRLRVISWNTLSSLGTEEEIVENERQNSRNSGVNLKLKEIKGVGCAINRGIRIYESICQHSEVRNLSFNARLTCKKYASIWGPPNTWNSVSFLLALHSTSWRPATGDGHGRKVRKHFFSQICPLVLLLFQISRLCVLGCLHCDLSRASPYTGRDNRSGCRTLISINFEITGSVSLVSPSTMLVIPFDVLHCNWNQLSDSMLKMVLCHGVQQGK